MGSHLDSQHLRVGIRDDAHSWRQDAELLIANLPFRSSGRLMFHSAPLGLGSFSPVAGYKHHAPNGAGAPDCERRVGTSEAQARRAAMFIAPEIPNRLQLRRSAMFPSPGWGLGSRFLFAACTHGAPTGLNRSSVSAGYKHQAPNGAGAPGCKRRAGIPEAQARRAVMFVAPVATQHRPPRRGGMWEHAMRTD